MSAAPYNNWNVSYSTITYLEKALSTHSNVDSFSRSKDILFKIDLKSGHTVTALLLNEYTLGLAAVHEAIYQFPNIQFIANGSNWNEYTGEAKAFGRTKKIGIGTIAELLRFLNRK
jgi:hypothetical protein